MCWSHLWENGVGLHIQRPVLAVWCTDADWLGVEYGCVGEVDRRQQ